MRLLPAHRIPGAPARGQAMVEFALVLPILAVLLVMAIDFGRVFFGWVALHNASRIAADFAASHTDNWTTSEDTYRALVRGDLEAINCFPSGSTTWGDGDIPDPDYPAGTAVGSPAVVTLECSFELITPLAASILGGPVTVGAESSFPVHKAIQQPLPPNTEPEPEPPPDPDPDPNECGAPVASFTWSPVPARKNQVTSFSDASSIGTCTVIAWSWDFDHNGATSSQQNPSYTYTWSGNSTKRYDVTLQITTTGGVDSVTREVEAIP